ncbi:MAG: HAMP domain-containing histidine kinase [Lachnospiraceae bacterium]|nr:HAMP domain-containing histidine kinase [Lachnospiraceae bacterium]
MKRFLKSYFRSFFIIAAFILINFYIFLDLVKIEEQYSILAYKLAGVNIVFMSLIVTVVEMIVYHWSVKKPLGRIIDGIKRFMTGRFREKIETFQKTDLDEFNQIITGLNEMADELSYMEAIRTDFIANVSHEMKTPLSVIQNYSVLLQTPNLLEEKRQKYARSIVWQTKKMSQMFSNILKLSKLENQKFFPNVENYNLGEQLCECMLLYEEVWEEKKMKIETDLEENVIVCQDRELLSQVWINLISNAVKFTQEGDTISLKLRKEEENVIVTIQDTGCGMDENVLKNIFYKFYQGDTSHAMPGNGLGLPLVKSILNACEGTIEVHSTPGQGSRFTVILNGRG